MGAAGMRVWEFRVDRVGLNSRHRTAFRAWRVSIPFASRDLPGADFLSLQALGCHG
jgi:hypothetical protein